MLEYFHVEEPSDWKRWVDRMLFYILEDIKKAKKEPSDASLNSYSESDLIIDENNKTFKQTFSIRGNETYSVTGSVIPTAENGFMLNINTHNDKVPTEQYNTSFVYTGDVGAYLVENYTVKNNNDFVLNHAHLCKEESENHLLTRFVYSKDKRWQFPSGRFCDKETKAAYVALKNKEITFDDFCSKLNFEKVDTIENVK